MWLFVYPCEGIKIFHQLKGRQHTQIVRVSDSAAMQAVCNYARSSEEKGREAGKRGFLQTWTF